MFVKGSCWPTDKLVALPAAVKKTLSKTNPSSKLSVENDLNSASNASLFSDWTISPC